jgi:hypothetical protein
MIQIQYFSRKKICPYNLSVHATTEFVVTLGAHLGISKYYFIICKLSKKPVSKRCQNKVDFDKKKTALNRWYDWVLFKNELAFHGTGYNAVPLAQKWPLIYPFGELPDTS